MVPALSEELRSGRIMPFIRFTDAQDYERGYAYLLQDSSQKTSLQGRGGRHSAVFFVDTATGYELSNQGIGYTELQEANLKGELSELGHRLYEFWKERRPELSTARSHHRCVP